MRFTLAACLALMALCAVLCFLLTTQPNVASYFLLIAITILAPVCAVAGIVYGRDNLRAFCIGAALPLALLVWSSSQELREISLSPAAYGWASQEQQQAAASQLEFATLALLLDGSGNVVNTPGTGISGASGLQGSLGLGRLPSHARTLERATAMTGPTCTLCIAAVICGVLVMAIRGGLAQKEPAASHPR